MGRTEDERIADNERKINALKMENARLKKKSSERERKRDTRRKVIAGGVVLKHAEIDEAFASELYALLDRFVLDRDRHLFDLPPIDADGKEPKGPARAKRDSKGLDGGPQ